MTPTGSVGFSTTKVMMYSRCLCGVKAARLRRFVWLESRKVVCQPSSKAVPHERKAGDNDKVQVVRAICARGEVVLSIGFFWEAKRAAGTPVKDSSSVVEKTVHFGFSVRHNGPYR